MTSPARAVPSVEPDGPASGVPAPRPAPSRVPDPPPDTPPPHSLAPRRPRTIGGGVFLVVLAATVTGVVLVASDWRAGLTLTGGALLCAAAARLVLPNGQAGMLGVRRKLVDVTTLVLLGGGLVVLAALIPPRAPL